jgi:TolB protein
MRQLGAFVAFALAVSVGALADAAPRSSAPPAVSFVARGTSVVPGNVILCTVAASGGDPVRALRASGDYLDDSWSLDGRTVAVVSRAGRGSVVETMRPDGRATHLIGRDPSFMFQRPAPAWAPDGRRLAVVLGRSLYVMRSDGSRRRLLAKGGQLSFAARPVWAPDGRRIFFAAVSVGPVSTLEFSIRPDGTGLRVEPNAVGVPSPDRRLRAWTRWQDGQLYVSRPDGSDVRKLTADEPLRVESPTWSPDGSQLAFALRPQMVGGAQQPADVAVVQVDGSGERRLTRTPFVDESAPAWRPRPVAGYGPCVVPR